MQNPSTQFEGVQAHRPKLFNSNWSSLKSWKEQRAVEENLIGLIPRMTNWVFSSRLALHQISPLFNFKRVLDLILRLAREDGAESRSQINDWIADLEQADSISIKEMKQLTPKINTLAAALPQRHIDPGSQIGRV
ncbi:BQ5605_C026g10226 [Microbotryum silenes-dioicae]|uniref:BQ5605_C026g10226 protein n=1 Tax=Microbotryum silenes-dioicae TaxID=796604 RepID=A0A2X0MQL9_9BASI|nr:BQ5605_C026g10226 [Microbotryum silenes-dioicae]